MWSRVCVFLPLTTSLASNMWCSPYRKTEKLVKWSSPVKARVHFMFVRNLPNLWWAEDKAHTRFVPSLKTRSHPITGRRTRLTSCCYETNGWAVFSIPWGFKVSCNVIRVGPSFAAAIWSFQSWTNEAGERVGMRGGLCAETLPRSNFYFQKVMHFFSAPPDPQRCNSSSSVWADNTEEEEEKKATWGLKTDLS